MLSRKLTAVATALSAALFVTVLGAGPATASSGPTVSGTLPSGVESYGAAITPNGKDLWVGGLTSDNVVELNIATKAVVRTISAPNAVLGIALSQDGKQLWVANYASGTTVGVYSTSSGALLHSITVGLDPTQIVFNRAHTKAYVPNYGDNNTVSVISTSTYTVTHTIAVPVAWSIALNKSGSRAYVTGMGASAVSIIDTSTNAVTGQITVPGTDQYSVIASPNGKRLYVVDEALGTVTAISLPGNKVIGTVTVGEAPCETAVSKDSSTIYVANYLGDDVSVISAKTLKVESTVSLPAGARPFRPVIAPNGQALFVTDTGTRNVSVIVLKREATATVEFGGSNPVLNAGNRGILRKLVAGIPTGANHVSIRIVGYTNVLSSVNLDLERAGATEAYLKSLGLKGTYTRVSGGVKSREAVVTVKYTP